MNESGDILICGAVEAEISHLASRIESPVESAVGRKKLISGKLAGKKVRALVTGPGLVNCAHALACAIEAFSPRAVIQTGCAGAFPRSGLEVGDIGIASDETDAHLGLELCDDLKENDEPGGSEIGELPFALFGKDGVSYTNRYPIGSDLIERARDLLSKRSRNPGAPKVATGPFLTVSTITATDARAERLHSLYRPIMESMEGSAAAHLSILYDLPLLEIRGASNMVGKRERAAWNIPLACQRACEAVHRIVAQLDL